ncbi:MAG: NAD-binding protein [Vulcanimicrobiota bacterium]
MSSKPRIVIAGAGQTGRALSVRLQSLWEVVVVDLQAGKEGLLPGVTFVTGDATSSLVLNQAGMRGASAAVGVTGRDDVNVEFCRLARQIYEVPNVMSATRQSEHLKTLEELGVFAISRPDSVASNLQSRLERGKRTTSDVGLGQGEILEVTVLRNSSVIGKSMADLSPKAWLVAAIYRRGQLVVPHGETRVEEGDRVLLVGDPAILPAIADVFRAGDSEFPLQFGNMVYLAHQSVKTEASYLVEHTKALGLTDVLEGAGCSVFRPLQFNWLDYIGMGKAAAFQQLEQSRAPILLARGTFPYRKIVVAVGSGEGGEVELGIDVARILGVSEITAVTVLPPTLVVGVERLQQLEDALQRAVRLGQAFRLKVHPVSLQGNPLTQLLEYSKEFDLLVISHRRRRGIKLTRPDVSRLLLLRSPISTMVLCTGGR